MTVIDDILGTLPPDEQERHDRKFSFVEFYRRPALEAARRTIYNKNERSIEHYTIKRLHEEVYQNALARAALDYALMFVWERCEQLGIADDMLNVTFEVDDD